MMDTLDFNIYSSTGSHRYERWNEESLKVDDCTRGWCCPSWDMLDKEYIIIELTDDAEIYEIALTPRIRSDGNPSEKSFPKSIALYNMDQGQNQLLALREDIKLSSLNEDYVIKPAPVRCKRMKIQIEAKNYFLDDKSYTCFINLKIYGKIIEKKNPGYYKKNTENFDFYSKNGYYKSGLSCADDISIEVFNLLKEQVSSRNYANKTKVIVCRKGSILVEINENSFETLTEGSLLIIQPDNSFSVRGLNEKNSYLLIFNMQELFSVWEAR